MNGLLVPPPDNWAQLEQELSFENNSPDAVLNATKLEWKGENAHTIVDWAKAGLTGGLGIFEGIPLQVKICNTQLVAFNGIIDLTDSETKWTCDKIQVKIRDKRMDMVSQLMDSISFAYLATPVNDPNGNALNGAGIIRTYPISQGGDYVVIPYQRNNVPDGLAFFTTALAIYNIAEKTYDVLNVLVGIVTGTLGAATVAGAGAVVLGVLQFVFYTIYLAAMILVIIALMKAAFNYLVAPVLTKFGMYAHTLIERACQYFGIGFSSSILQNYPMNRLVVMPMKQAWINNQTFQRTLMNGIIGGSTVNNRMEYDDLYNSVNGGFAYGYWDGTCGDFIRALGEMFNAKAKVILNGLGQPVLHIERWDYNYNMANYQLPNISDQVPFNSTGVFMNTGFSQSAFTTNASEIASNYYVKYAMDDTDENTYNYYEGSVCYCTNKPAVINNIKNVTLKNLTEVNLRFAQAFRKDKLTATEEALLPLWDAAAGITNAVVNAISGVNTVINTVTGIVGVPQLPTLQNNGLQQMPSKPAFAQSGHLLLTNDSTGVPKVFIAGPDAFYDNWFDWKLRTFTGTQIDPSNKNIIGARYLMKNYHFSNLPKTVYPGPPYSTQPAGTPYYNQWLKYADQRIPVCCEEFELIRNNNIIKNFQGQFARVDSLRWNPHKGIGSIDYRVNVPYTKNLVTSFVIDGVQTTAAL